MRKYADCMYNLAIYSWPKIISCNHFIIVNNNNCVTIIHNNTYELIIRRNCVILSLLPQKTEIFYLTMSPLVLTLIVFIVVLEILFNH